MKKLDTLYDSSAKPGVEAMLSEQFIRLKQYGPPIMDTLLFNLNFPEDWLSTRLEKQNGDLPEVEVNEVLRLVSHVGAEVATDNTMPSRIVFLVELLFDVGRNVLWFGKYASRFEWFVYLFDVVFLKRLRRAIDGVLLHILAHIGVLYHCFAFGHGRYRVSDWAFRIPRVC